MKQTKKRYHSIPYFYLHTTLSYRLSILIHNLTNLAYMSYANISFYSRLICLTTVYSIVYTRYLFINCSLLLNTCLLIVACYSSEANHIRQEHHRVRIYVSYTLCIRLIRELHTMSIVLVRELYIRLGVLKMKPHTISIVLALQENSIQLLITTLSY